MSRRWREEIPPADASGTDNALAYARAATPLLLAQTYIAMCELGSLQSDWPVKPPRARTCAVYTTPGVSPSKVMCCESPVNTLGSQSPLGPLMRPSYMLVFLTGVTRATSCPLVPFLMTRPCG